MSGCQLLTKKPEDSHTRIGPQEDILKKKQCLQPKGIHHGRFLQCKKPIPQWCKKKMVIDRIVSIQKQSAMIFLEENKYMAAC